MALNYSECLEMLRVSEETGQKLFVAYYRRALPYFRKVKELIDKGSIGRILTVDIRFFRPPAETDLDPARHTWRVKKDIAGEGYFYDLAPHTIDILDYLLGEIEEVWGVSGNLGGLYCVKDTVGATFRFRSGVIGSGIWSFVASGHSQTDSITLTGTNGQIHFNTFSFEPVRLISDNRSENFITPQPEHIQQPLIQTIVDELRGKGICPSNGISGARTSKVIDQIFGDQQ
jgi:predicted dehydrogenase